MGAPTSAPLLLKKKATGGRCVLTVLAELPSQGLESPLGTDENLQGRAPVPGRPLDKAKPSQAEWGK